MIRKPEWMEYYSKVHAKQQEYLQQMADLRNSIQNREDYFTIASVDRMRSLQGRQQKGRQLVCFTEDPQQSKRVAHGPQPFPKRASVSHERQRRFYIAPHPSPRKLEPILRRIREKNSFEQTSEGTRPSTDYEPIEVIAKRNGINLNGIFQRVRPTPTDNLALFNQQPSWQAHQDRRKQLSVTPVTVKYRYMRDQGYGDVKVMGVPRQYVTGLRNRQPIREELTQRQTRKAKQGYFVTTDTSN